MHQPRSFFRSDQSAVRASFKLMRIELAILVILVGSGCAISHDTGAITAPLEVGSVDIAIADLKKFGVDPSEKKMSVLRNVDGKAYFQGKPENDYWMRGRRKVGNRTVDLIIFVEPKLILGGGHSYFFEAGTNQLLWVLRQA